MMVASPSTPIKPPMSRGHGERAIDSRNGTARRGYLTAFSPNCSPAKTTTSTNEMTTTPPAAKRYSHNDAGRS